MKSCFPGSCAAAMGGGTMLFLFLLLLLGTFGSIGATTRHVPADYPTIQSALDALVTGDTVLVDTGVYEEALLAPSVYFVLRGNVVPDTGDYPRPIIDPSSLPNPTSLSCLRKEYDELIVEDMVFRNRLPMYPHAWDTAGGIHHPSGQLTLRRCVFDSTYNATWVFWANVVASHCDFRNLSGEGIRTFGGWVTITDCNFHSNMVTWAQVSSSGNSLVERCHFWGSYGNQSVLNMAGPNIQVRDCVFGPGTATTGYRFYFSAWSSVFENNVIEDWVCGQGLWVSDVNGDGPLYIRHNVVRNCVAAPNSALNGFQLSMSETCDSCVIAFDSNAVVDCHSQWWGILGIDAQRGSIVARGNRFANLYPAAVHCDDPYSIHLELHDNLFYGNGMALRSDSGTVTDARWNWWGDSTGPYHSPDHLEGHGDIIVGLVDFDPWYRDTTFFPPTAVPSKARGLPGDYSLSVYPNPFNPVATLQFGIERAGRVVMEVYNVNGQRVKTLADGEFAAGYHAVVFNASELPSGIYLARLAVNEFSKTEKIVLLK